MVCGREGEKKPRGRRERGRGKKKMKKGRNYDE
jgi:hypothetical protein